MIKTILFDNDGVLVDTEKHFFKATQIVLGKNGIELTKEQFVELTLVGNEGGWRLARNKNYTEIEIDEMRNERNRLYSEYLLKEKLLIEGVVKVLKQLSHTHKLGIVTSSKRSHFDMIHRDTDILQYFSFVLTREDYSISKPSPEPYLKALEVSHSTAGESIVIEDSERGLMAAFSAGLKCIVIPSHLTLNCDFSKAWKVVKNIEELPGIL